MPEIANKTMLDTLADAIAALTGLARPATPSAASKCAVWSHASVREFSTDEYTTFRIWSGMETAHGPTRLHVQASTLGKTAASAILRAETIHNAFIETTGDYDDRPRHEWHIGGVGTGYTIKGIHELGMPRSIGSNELGHEVVFDIELSYVRD